MILAVASGKGGTGKTTVSINLARVFGDDVQLFDCDVEEPNVNLFLRGTGIANEIVHLKMPHIQLERCSGCGDCSTFCEFNAIAIANNKAMVFPELCHACGACALVCPHNAIDERDNRIGTLDTLHSNGITLIQGTLDVGVSSASPLIDALKRRLPSSGIAILDAPPGTSCPAVATVRKTDYTILVTEPTPFGLHDLKLAVDMLRHIGIPFGVVINRHGIGDDRVHAYCRKENIPLLLVIPDDRRIAESYSRGEVLIDVLPEYRMLFEQLRDRVLGQASIS